MATSTLATASTAVTTLKTTYHTAHLYELAAPSRWLGYYPDTAIAEQPPETEDIHLGNDPPTCSHSRSDHCAFLRGLQHASAYRVALLGLSGHLDALTCTTLILGFHAAHHVDTAFTGFDL